MANKWNLGMPLCYRATLALLAIGVGKAFAVADLVHSSREDYFPGGTK